MSVLILDSLVGTKIGTNWKFKIFSDADQTWHDIF